jgi:Rrf2 family protein
MLTQTSELGVNVLLYLGLRGRDQGPATPREMAEAIDTSPTYTAKVCSQLVKANILRSQRGALGGVLLSRKPEDLTLLEIVEACQGRILADYCEEVTDKRRVCAYHIAMVELQLAITTVLRKWTLAELMLRPKPAGAAAVEGHCRITRGWSALQDFLDGKLQPEPEGSPRR